ncbi:MAG: hypothetical protein HQM13_08685 [SAR324 cluster bacterium]|nr:hypothetical protein [SAR324 cluster bacterium]
MGFLWAVVALSMAFGTFAEFIVTPDLSLILWFLLHCIAALLFLIRNPPVQYSSSKIAYFVALASVNYYLLYDPHPASEMVGLGQFLIVLGGLMGIASTLSLGKCFGILPVCRGVRTSAAYRLIRHPIYASYIVLDSGIIVAHPSLGNFIIFSIAVLLFVLRIRYEEEVLLHSTEYADYKKHVKYKLIPHLY